MGFHATRLERWFRPIASDEFRRLFWSATSKVRPLWTDFASAISRAGGADRADAHSREEA